MSEQQEKKNKTIAWVISLGIHGLLLLAFFLMMAWRAPNPPLPEYGIELNFGMDDQGGGDIQPETSPGATEEATPEKVEEEETETTQPVEEVKEEADTEKVDEPVVSKVESPVVVKEEKKEPVKEVVKPNPKDIPKEVPTEVKVTEKKGAEAKKGDPTTSQGDDGKQGNKGNPESINQATVYDGQQGGGGGADGFGLVGMSGWEWVEPPKIPELDDNYNGIVVFKITCDEYGDIIKIETDERGLSPKSERLLREEILRNSLQRKDGSKAPPKSEGFVKFTLRSK